MFGTSDGVERGGDLRVEVDAVDDDEHRRVAAASGAAAASARRRPSAATCPSRSGSWRGRGDRSRSGDRRGGGIAGALTGTARSPRQRQPATGAVAPATGRSAAAVDVAMLQARRGPRARGRGSCDGRDGSRMGPSVGPVGECEAAGLAGTTASPKRGGDDRAAHGVHLLGPGQTPRSAVNTPLIRHLAPSDARFHDSARAQRSVQKGARGANLAWNSRRAGSTAALAGGGAGTEAPQTLGHGLRVPILDRARRHSFGGRSLISRGLRRAT